jgi:chemotaxis protein CheX
MDVRYINPFIASVKTVFETMVMTNVTVGKPIPAGGGNDPVVDVSAVIGLSGDAVGAVVLSFDMDTASNIASKFAGIELKPDHPDFSDALGELCNMVAGQAKAKLEGLNCSISLPSVIIGREHIVSQSRSKPRLLLPCQSDLGKFHVEVAMVVEKNANAPAAASAAV